MKDVVGVTKICPMCGRINEIEVPRDIWDKVTNYWNGVGYIQDIPLPANQREFIKTGMCLGCQEIIFAEPDF